MKKNALIGWNDEYFGATTIWRIYRIATAAFSYQDVALVDFSLRSIKSMFCNAMNNGGHSNNADTTSFGSEFPMTIRESVDLKQKLSNSVCMKASHLHVKSKLHIYMKIGLK
jgi:hypothetical protein